MHYSLARLTLTLTHNHNGVDALQFGKAYNDGRNQG